MANEDETAEILTDAQLVIDFASRAGLLEHPNDPLIEEVHKIRNQVGDGSSRNIHLGNLYVALSKAVKTIAPYISLRELRDGYSPFNKPTWVRKISVVCLLVLFSFSLVLTITLIQRLENNLTQLNEINAVNKVDLENQVQIVARRILDGSLKNPESEGFTSYWVAYDTAKKTTAQIKHIISYAAMQDDGPLYNFIKQLFPFVVMGTRPDMSINANSLNANPFGDFSAYANFKKDVPSASYYPRLNNKKVNAASNHTLPISVSCKDLQKDFIASDGVEAAEKREAFTKCIVTSLGFLDDTGKQSLVMIARERTMEVYVLAAWLLPLFAGMLGASVYLIYNYYFEKMRPLGSPTRVLIRFILGGIAGVIIGWFYAPARYPGNGVELINSIRQFPFMFAFLAGFSSEYAFSFMTRLISTTSNQVGVKPTAGQRGTAP